MKKKSLCLFVILSVLLALVGCSKGSSSGSSAAAPAETEAAAPVIESAGTVTSTGSVKSAEVDETTNYKDTVIIGIANDVNNLDPQGSNTDANMMVFYLTHERLVNIDPDTNEVIPALAVFLNMKSFPPDAMAAERSQTQSTSVTLCTNCDLE